MAITKLNSPLLVNGQPVYPKTSADQVTFKDCPPSSLQDMFNLIYPVGSIYIYLSIMLIRLLYLEENGLK